MRAYFKSKNKDFYLLKGDCIELLNNFEHRFAMAFADPPYFLSNDGLTIKSGKIVSVNKGDWDKFKGLDYLNDFNAKWLEAVRSKLADNGTIWISGTSHNIFSIGQLLSELNFRILNIVTWQKNNPPPNFSCRVFTHSTEQIIWARKSAKVPHYFNYDLMKKLNDNKQMTDVWKLPAIARWETKLGKHPTQKPLSVLARIILASTKQNAWILDPFTGSSTTGIAANILNRRFLGIDLEEEYLELSKARYTAIQHPRTAAEYKSKLQGFTNEDQLQLTLAEEPQEKYRTLLKFT